MTQLQAETLQMDSNGSGQEILNQFDPFMPAEMSQPRMAGHKSRVEYFWHVFPYLLTAFVIFAGFFVSAKVGSKYLHQKDDIKIFGLPWGRRQSFAIPRTFFRTLQQISEPNESKNYQSGGMAVEKPAAGVRRLYHKLKAICRRWISRRVKSEDSYTIVNLLGIVEVRRKGCGEKAQPKEKRSPARAHSSGAPLTNMATVLKRWDDILRLLFSV